MRTSKIKMTIEIFRALQNCFKELFVLSFEALAQWELEAYPSKS